MEQQPFTNTNKNITKKVMKQYEYLRQEGKNNMLDFYANQRRAAKLGFYEFDSLEKEDYIYILSNYTELIKLYNIHRTHRLSVEEARED